MSLPGLIRDRNSGLRKRRLEVYGRNRFLQEYRSYHADCLRIDADALPAALAFNPTSQQDILLVADDKGTVGIVNTDALSQDRRERGVLLHQWRPHRSAISDAKWTCDGTGILISSADHSISYWKDQQLVSSFQSPLGSGSVKCLAPSPTDPHVFAAGGRDCDLSIYDTREKRKVIATQRILPCRHIDFAHFDFPAEKKKKRSITVEDCKNKTISSAIYTSQYELYSCGMSDKCIKLWDTRKLCRYTDNRLCLKSPKGPTGSARPFTSLAASSTSIFASCYDGNVYEFQRDMPEGPRRAFQGHELKGTGNNLVKIAVSPDGKYLLSGSTDGCPRIYPLEEPILDEYPRTYPIVRSLKGVKIGKDTEPVMFVAWSRKNRIGLAADDCIVSIFNNDILEKRHNRYKDETVKAELVEDELKISYKNSAKPPSSEFTEETLSEMNRKFKSMSTGPSKIWHNFRTTPVKRKFVEDQTTPKPASKKILIKSSRSNILKPSTPGSTPKSSIKNFFSPRPKQ